MRVIGISCWYHDSAVAYIENGHIKCAVQEERFSRKKHDPNLAKIIFGDGGVMNFVITK